MFMLNSIEEPNVQSTQNASIVADFKQSIINSPNVNGITEADLLLAGELLHLQSQVPMLCRIEDGKGLSMGQIENNDRPFVSRRWACTFSDSGLQRLPVVDHSSSLYIDNLNAISRSIIQPDG